MPLWEGKLLSKDMPQQALGPVFTEVFALLGKVNRAGLGGTLGRLTAPKAEEAIGGNHRPLPPGEAPSWVCGSVSQEESGVDAGSDEISRGI